MKYFLLGFFVCLTAWSKSSITFEKKKLTLGKISFVAEIADSEAKRSQGLMFRQELAKDAGMLFIFSKEETLNFWTKNTFVALSIGFFDKTKTLVDVQDMAPVKSEMEKPSTYVSAKPAQYALEMPLGWFASKKIKIGDRISF
jgi:uncharacterized protein